MRNRDRRGRGHPGCPEIRLRRLSLSGDGAPDGRAAEEVILTGRDLTAPEARDLGIVNRIVGTGTLDGSIDEYTATHFASRLPPRCASPRGGAGGRRLEVEQRLAAAEALYVDELLALHDGSEGIRAFMEKRPPQWKNS